MNGIFKLLCRGELRALRGEEHFGRQASFSFSIDVLLSKIGCEGRDGLTEEEVASLIRESERLRIHRE